MAFLENTNFTWKNNKLFFREKCQDLLLDLIFMNLLSICKHKQLSNISNSNVDEVVLVIKILTLILGPLESFWISTATVPMGLQLERNPFLVSEHKNDSSFLNSIFPRQSENHSPKITCIVDFWLVTANLSRILHPGWLNLDLDFLHFFGVETKEVHRLSANLAPSLAGMLHYLKE